MAYEAKSSEHNGSHSESLVFDKTTTESLSTLSFADEMELKRFEGQVGP